MQVALGFLNMSLAEFWDFTPRQLQLKLDGRREYEEMIQRFEWERMRFQTTALINKDRKRSNQIKQIDLVKFDWEKNEGMKNKESEMSKAMYLIEKEKRKKLKNKT
jgi:hypothetical protein